MVTLKMPKDLNASRSENTLGVQHSTLNAKSNLSQELRFLIACCQTNLSKEDIKFICSFLSLMPRQEMPLGCTNEQSQITALALRHGILPLLYKTIKEISQLDSSSLNAERLTLNAFLSKLKTQYMIIAQRNMLMAAELIRIIQLLEKNSIEALAFKGPALSQMVYGDITLRQYIDLDVLTKKEDVYKIDSLLKEQGYERLLTLTPVQEKIWIQYAHDIGLIHSEKGVHFEMHWSFLDEDYPMQVDLEDFWEETQEVKLNGHPIPTFSNENLLIYLSIHGSKHLWERIEWIKDIDLLVRKNKIDWEKIIEKSKGTGFEKMIYLGFSLSTLLLDTPLPNSIINEIHKYQQIDTISSFILESWDKPKSTFQKTKTMLKLFPGIKEQAIYLHKIILKPSFNEYWSVDLPKGFYWGYYLLRPYLLMKKYFTKQEA